MSFILSCCSTSDLTKEHYEQRNLHYICYHYHLGDNEYPDDFGQTIPFKEFYSRMAKGEMTKTSQINIEEFIEYFEPFLKEGLDIIHVTLSSGLTGTINSARLAAETLLEKYKDRKIEIIDSLAASSGYGLLMDKLADLRDEGKSFEEIVDFAINNRLYVHHWFFSTDLKYYYRGGRISKTSFLLGNLLNICPLLDVNDEGKLIPLKKCLGVKQASKMMLNAVNEHIRDGKNYCDKIYISHSDFESQAKIIANEIEKNYPKMKGKVEIYSIGTVIGSHSGPGTVAIFFWGDKRGKK